MKPNFALSLSFDGLRLMHRVTGGWHMVGYVALDNADVTVALANLKTAADVLEPNGITTKLLIPNDQIKYLAIDSTRADDESVREALHGATPYAVGELAYDFVKGGGRTYIAAVARETLDEAQDFAAEHEFNPVCFAAVPEPFTYVGEAFFGATKGQTAQRDDQPVIVIGNAGVDLSEPVQSIKPAIEPSVEPDLAPDLAPAVDLEPQISDVKVEVALDVADQPETVLDIAPALDSARPSEVADTPDTDAAPVFASRLRADRYEGRPTSPVATPSSTSKSTRAEPTFRPNTPASLVVPTGKSRDAMPPLSAPNRDADPTPTTAHIITDAPDTDIAPPITGEAPTALPAQVAVAAASLSIAPDSQEVDMPNPVARPAALGGIFASRRMTNVNTTSDSPDVTDAPDKKSRLTVFGARKKPVPKPKVIVGGKPRFLGLILTAILLLFLLAFAAFAALSEDGIASWFGFDNEGTQIATDVSEPVALPDLIAAQPTGSTDTAATSDALAIPTAPEGGQVLSPEQAARIYAATGVWQRAPRIPLTPRTTSLQELTLGASLRPVPRVPASPLASASSVAGDALIAPPIDPPAPDATFNFGADGVIVATAQGSLTPDGILIIAGPPPLEPPTRPGTIAPEVTPQDQLAAVIPQTATALADAPEGVIIISGRPTIEPPVRTGTAVPAPAPAPALEATALATGDAPLLATDGLLVFAGSPPALPPVRPEANTAPTTPEAPIDLTTVLPTPDAPDANSQPEGLNVIAGAPPVLPPVRPVTLAPQTNIDDNAAVQNLTTDITTALTTGIAQAPTPNTRRPQVRPAAVIQAAAAATTTLAPEDARVALDTASQAPSMRPLLRPAGLAPVPTPQVEPVTPQQIAVQTPAPVPTQPTTLQISPEIAAAILAAANRPNPIVNPTALAVPVSSRPDLRPRNMERIVARAATQAATQATQAAAVAPRTVAPSGPTGGSVAQNATLDNAINLRDVNLIGIYGGSGDRRALVRLGNGRYMRVTVGDRLDGGRVTAISAGALSYTKRGRALTLQVAG